LSGKTGILPFVDPLPQAMILTAIVIGVATTALLLAIAVRIFKKYKTFDIRKVNTLKG
jgi:multisubunit Na+/H+ antiporter MnhC subunit